MRSVGGAVGEGGSEVRQVSRGPVRKHLNCLGTILFLARIRTGEPPVCLCREVINT